MSYFGSAGPANRTRHSVLAGYQRRSNQLKARSTSRYNVGVNLGNIADRLNDGYNTRMTPAYGKPEVLQRKVNAWQNQVDTNVRKARFNLTTARELKGKHEAQLTVISENHAYIADQLKKMPEEIDADNVATARLAVQEVDSSYNIINYETVYANKQAEIKADAISVAKARAAQDTINDVTDKVYMKGVEDFMVDGRLMRESKAAIVVVPATAFLVAAGIGILYFGFLQPKKTLRFGSGNKSAAMAVFN